MQVMDGKYRAEVLHFWKRANDLAEAHWLPLEEGRLVSTHRDYHENHAVPDGYDHPLGEGMGIHHGPDSSNQFALLWY